MLKGIRFDVLLLLYLKENISCTLLTISEELVKVHLEKKTTGVVVFFYNPVILENLRG
jgi:hypothetical protein